MNTVDLILIIFTIVMFLLGWRSGLVRSLGSLMALGLSITVAYYGQIWIHNTFGISLTSNPWIAIVSFLVLMIIVNKLAGYIVDVLDLVRKAIAIIPFVNTINSLLGAIFGVAQSVAIILVVAYITVTFVPTGSIRSSILSSSIIGYSIDVETGAGIL